MIERPMIREHRKYGKGNEALEKNFIADGLLR